MKRLPLKRWQHGAVLHFPDTKENNDGVAKLWQRRHTCIAWGLITGIRLLCLPCRADACHSNCCGEEQ
ncbi:MAG: hypothetical protein LBR49_07070 [Tannerella sp.]|nr:hypothetical protein [Tannerella sp.]